jgi:dihydrofolate reductase
MRKIVLYIAVSLDGKIARKDGDVKWLDEFSDPEQMDYGYNDFLNSIDTTFMGNNTYKQLLGFGIDFPYRGKTNYVFTRNAGLSEDKNVKYISGDPVSFVRDIKSSAGGDIWLIGGAEINTVLLNAGLIDEVIIFIIPLVLGEGIPLFRDVPGETNLEMIKTKTYSNGVVELNYRIYNA